MAAQLDPDPAGLSVEIDSELAEVVKRGVEMNRFSTVSRVSLFEASVEGTCYEPGLFDTELETKLNEIRSWKDTTQVRIRTLFIPWAVFDKQLAVTPTMLISICTTFGVPSLFIEGMLEPMYWVRPGNGLFLYQDDNGQYSKFNIFYRYAFGTKSGRAYIFTTYDFKAKLTTNICVNFIPNAMPFVEKHGSRVAQSTLEQPLALHVLIATHAHGCWEAEGSDQRVVLLQDEYSAEETNPKLKTRALHGLSQRLHILTEDLGDFEEQLTFLAKASEAFTNIVKPGVVSEGAPREIDMITYLHSKCQHSKRWISNYKDRAEIRINLAFHLSSQLDNDLSFQISKATTALARDAQRDSSSMITIAAVTMFFLPGTFISAVFSMTFFNFQQDSTGQQQFQVSDRWWYFLAATIPLTILVFVVWIVWQKHRARKFLEQDILAQRDGTNMTKDEIKVAREIGNVSAAQRAGNFLMSRLRGRRERPSSPFHECRE